MNKFSKTGFAVVAGVAAALMIWLIPGALARAFFVERNYSAVDWGLILFVSILGISIWGLCIHALYRTGASGMLSLIGWFIPLGTFIFHVRNAGTYRAAVFAMIATASIVAGNGLGRAFSRRDAERSGHKVKVIIVAWAILGVLVAKLCPRFVMYPPRFFGASIGLLVFGGAYCHLRGPGILLRWPMCAVVLVSFAMSVMVYGNMGLKLVDSLICTCVPILAVLFGFAETRWEEGGGRPCNHGSVSPIGNT